jgi:hypothetical protein
MGENATHTSTQTRALGLARELLFWNAQGDDSVDPIP